MGTSDVHKKASYFYFDSNAMRIPCDIQRQRYSFSSNQDPLRGISGQLNELFCLKNTISLLEKSQT
jgi:hypothetical protein